MGMNAILQNHRKAVGAARARIRLEAAFHMPNLELLLRWRDKDWA